MTDTLRVVQPGLLTTIQDLGRPHVAGAGVPAGGAMDRFAHTAANLLVGNDRSAATLECTIRGPRLAALRACVIAITGADLGPTVNGDAVPAWTAVPLQEGDELGFGARGTGIRAYIAVAGGFLGDRWLGSMSTNLMSKRGGMHGRALIAGDTLSAGQSMVAHESGRSLEAALRPPYGERTLHSIPGPHAPRLTAGSRAALFGAPYALSPDSNRMGFRLLGPILEAPGEDVLSFALVAGVVQLPRGGQPILLMADYQTAGGYPVVATLATASLSVAAQLAPGDEIVFAEAPIEKALAMRAAQLAALASLTN
jgi:antagonist of KipI